MVQHNVQHLRREAALGCERVIAETRMLADFAHFLLGEQSRLVENGDRDERLADVMQKGCPHQAALVVLAHAQMLRKGNGKAGHKQAVADSCRCDDSRRPSAIPATRNA